MREWDTESYRFVSIYAFGHAETILHINKPQKKLCHCTCFIFHCTYCTASFFVSWSNQQTWAKFPFHNCIVPIRFIPWEIRIAFPGESQLRQSRATQPTVHAGCFRVSIIHRTLTWTTGSLTCAQMLMHAIAHGGVRTHVRESALKVDSGRIKKSLPRQGIEPAAAASRSDALPTKLHPTLQLFNL